MARLLRQHSGTPQVSRVTHATGLRMATVERPATTLPHMDPNDIDVIISAVDPIEWSVVWGDLLPVEDKVLWVERQYGAIAFLTRVGDQFNIDHGPDFQGIAEDAPINGGSLEFVNGNSVRRYRGATNFVALDDIIVAHSSLTESGGPTYPRTVDLFQPIFFDTAAETARFGTIEQPLANGTTAASTGHELAVDIEVPYKMCRLDGTHVAVGGNNGIANGRQPWMFMVEWDGEHFRSYGPWLFGAKSAEAGADFRVSMYLQRLDHQRLLVVWYDSVGSDNTSTSYLKPRRTLHAQVLTYDTTSHTMTAGPLRRFRANQEGEDSHMVFIPGAEIVVLFSMNWEIPGDYGLDSANYPGQGNEHLSAKTLIIQGDDVLEGVTELPFAHVDHTTLAWDDYWYSFQVVSAGDRILVIHPDVGEVGPSTIGDIRYTKLRVGVIGSERGAIGVYDEGVLFPAVTGEITRMGPQARLPDGSGLAATERYLDNYNYYIYNFVLAREQS